MRYRAARDGIPLLERPSDEFQRFQLAAVQFWCDTETVIAERARRRSGRARMSVAIDRELLAERAAAVDRHLRRVHTAATNGPADLRAFLAALRDHTG